MNDERSGTNPDRSSLFYDCDERFNTELKWCTRIGKLVCAVAGVGAGAAIPIPGAGPVTVVACNVLYEEMCEAGQLAELKSCNALKTALDSAVAKQRAAEKAAAEREKRAENEGLDDESGKVCRVKRYMCGH